MDGTTVVKIDKSREPNINTTTKLYLKHVFGINNKTIIEKRNDYSYST